MDLDDLVAIVRTTTPGYVPAGLEIRTSIATDLITVVVPAGWLDAVLADPRVRSVEISRPVNSIDAFEA
jgi:hypothetical protein